jgi:RsiW-degrading membrane proteinase PrsW (M82 family)
VKRRDFNQLKIILILNTIIQIIVFIYFVTNAETILQNVDRPIFMNIVPIFHFALFFLFLWFIWRRTDFENAKKHRNTHLVLWLGFLGMWIWIIDNKKFIKEN